MGSSVVRDPRYQRLALIAGGHLGAGPNVTAAILAQFACEKAGEWPPQDKNPGNVHSGPLHEAGWPLYPGGRGDSGAVALLPDPDTGALAYAQYIGHHPLYPAARAAIARDDANAYVAAVTGVGYGTPRSCWQGYLASARAALGASAGSLPPVHGSAVPPTGGDTGASSDAIAAALGKRASDNLTSGDIDKLAAMLVKTSGAPDPGGAFSAVTRATLHGELDGSVGHPISSIRPDILAGIAAAIGAVPAAIPPAAASVAADAGGLAADAARAAISAALGAVIPLVVGALILLVAGGMILGGTKDALAG